MRYIDYYKKIYYYQLVENLMHQIKLLEVIAMMNTIPYLLSSTTDDLLRATRRLEQATRESWAMDWSQFALKCPHKIMVNSAFVLENTLDSIRLYVEAQHALAKHKSKR